ncbi:hypothetical protein E4695_08660 [Alcaligenaceae bacterium 429]|nr:hypothetical protein E4695_08660 [Alcaligenaceae bacterium 429]
MTVAVPIDVRVYRFKPDNLDPVTVYVEQYAETASRIIIHCWDKAWAAFWGSHDDKGLEHFILNAHADYLLGYLLQGWEHRLLKQYVKHESIYLRRIIEAVKAEFAKHPPESVNLTKSSDQQV